MKTDDFDYQLPQELIAQRPVEPRDSSRLLVLHRETGLIEHRNFADITDYLRGGDALVFNDSRVIPARLRGVRPGSGGRVELLLLRRLDGKLWEALVKPARRLTARVRVELLTKAGDGKKPEEAITAEIIEAGEGGIRTIAFSDETSLLDSGEVPLPPYIHEPLKDPERYQTVYAKVAGSVAAPTAGLHFTPGLIRDIERKDVRCLFVTLHVGLDTFRPVNEADPRDHVISTEYGTVSEETAGELSQAKREGRRIICIGTTSVRLVEQAAQLGGRDHVRPFGGRASLFILPGYEFRMVDAMVTNFHLPRSTLLMLVSAFAGKGLIEKAYREAIEQRYRFYSFGDAMLIL